MRIRVFRGARGAGLAFFLAIGSGAARAQPSNDECSAPLPLVVGANFVDTTGATNSAGFPAACATSGADAWYVYTATLTGSATLSLCAACGSATFDSVLSAYTGACGGSLTSVACNDDVCGLQSQVTFPVTVGTTYLVRLAGFGAPAPTGSGLLCVTETLPLDDFGDASGSTAARHTNAIVSERLGTTVTAEAGTVTPSWYGDVGDDGIASVSNLFPGSTTATIVVDATNPNGTFTDFCRLWVDRNSTVGWSSTTDALPTQSAAVGPGGTSFTFGPFVYSATAPASPFVRVRLSFNTSGVSSATSTGQFGEVEDYVLPGSGGPVTTPSAGGGGADAGDAPVPYPPCNSTIINSERLGLGVSADVNAPVGPDAGDAAWDDDVDDGIVRIDGLTPGGSCTIVALASDPFATFTDTFGAWIDFDGDGIWDEVGEVFAPVSLSVGPAPVTATLGPLAIPVGAASLLRTRLKLTFGATGVQAAGVGFTFGEVEDYLLPPTAGIGCNTTPGPAPTIWAEDPPREGLPFTWKHAGLAPSVTTFMALDVLNFLPGGLDVSLLAPGLVPPATCFLYAGLSTVASLGPSDPAGNLSVTVPVGAGTAGATVYLQGFQVAPPLVLWMTPVLPLTILP